MSLPFDCPVGSTVSGGTACSVRSASVTLASLVTVTVTLLMAEAKTGDVMYAPFLLRSWRNFTPFACLAKLPVQVPDVLAMVPSR